MYILPILQTIFKSYIFTSNKSGTLIEACCCVLKKLKPMETKTRLKLKEAYQRQSSFP